jgi:hypothetical protein
MDMEQFRAVMCDANAAAEGIAAILEHEAEKPEHGDIAPYFVLLAESYRAAVQHVTELADSPIEKMLFNSLLMGCAAINPCGIVVRPWGPNAMDRIAEYRKQYAAMRSVIAGVKATRGERSVGGYLDYMRSEHGMSDSEADFWRGMELGSTLWGNAFHLIPQSVVPKLGPNGKAIRLDALVFVPNRPKLLVAIECDGYEWHRSKDAFDKDRRRDRALQAIGCDVLRFSGSEIHSNPVDASMDLYEKLSGLAKRSPTPRWRAPK